MTVHENALFHFLKGLRADVYAAQREGREDDRQAALAKIDALTPKSTEVVIDLTDHAEQARRRAPLEGAGCYSDQPNWNGAGGPRR